MDKLRLSDLVEVSNNSRLTQNRIKPLERKPDHPAACRPKGMASKMRKKMKTKIFHLQIDGKNKYYGSLQAVFLDNEDLGVSKSKLDRHDFGKPAATDRFTLTRAFIKTAGDVRRSKLKPRKLKKV